MAQLTRRLHCADNLEVLRGVPAGSVGMVYLDPPFNTGQDWYAKPAAGSRAAELAFTDRWQWSEDAAQQYKELTAPGSPQAPALEWFRGILGESGSLAYLLHMAARFPELHRILSPRGGLFLHIDDTMCAYLKVLLDQVFGPENFAGQITWKRTSAHTTKKGWARVCDTILVFRRSGQAPWCGPDGLMSFGGHGDVWLDIPPLNAAAKERLGWPTQKPVRLLSRIITLAGEPGSILLDPNCGCGTSLDAAQRAGLGWIGIDLSPAAISLTQARLRALGAEFEVHGAAAAPPPDGALF